MAAYEESAGERVGTRSGHKGVSFSTKMYPLPFLETIRHVLSKCKLMLITRVRQCEARWRLCAQWISC